jgi:hypothetical protein
VRTCCYLYITERLADSGSHLLGKKSWNVYNADNIARVRRDEAAAEAAEEAEELRMQEVDAQRRLAILRGEAPPPLELEERDEPVESQRSRRQDGHDRDGPIRRKRKRQGEDDTDFELRIAKERTDTGSKSLELAQRTTSSAPITDRRGHIDLFGDKKTRAHAEKNEEAERESQKKKREYEDQYTMRFSNAVGKHGTSSPWYSQADGEKQESHMKDTWGNDDPRRKERDTNRIVASDPLAMMKQGAARVRELKQERKRFQEEREEDLRQMRRDERRREKHRRREEDRHRRRSYSPKSDGKRRHSRDRRDDKFDGEHDRGRRRRDRDREHSHRRASRSPRERADRHGRHDSQPN